MNMLLPRALALLLLPVAFPAAHAALLVNESFDYPAGSLLPDFAAGNPAAATQPASLGGTGLSIQPRPFPDRTPVTIGHAGLSYTDSTGRALRTSGRSVIIPEGNSTVFNFYDTDPADPFARFRNPADPRDLGRPGETVWLSFLMMAAAEPTADHTFSLRITGVATSFPIGLLARGSSGAHTVGAGSAASKAVIAPRKTCLVVLRATFGETGETELWVNPDLGGDRPSSKPDLHFKKISVSFRSLWFNKQTNGELPVAFDELRVGESYADVAPIL
jgi:hypothetical protein